MIKSPDFGAVTSSADLLAIARAMEERSAERYVELAEAFEVSCNMDTASAFRELAAMEERHAADFPPATGPVPHALAWGEQDPEIADPDAVHYLMHPWHVFDLALRHEQQAAAFFTFFAEGSPHADVREEAARLAAREREHVAWMTARLAELPVPPDDWEDEGDPPNWDASD